MGNEIGTTAGKNNVIRQAYPFEGGVNIVKIVRGSGNPETILKKLPAADEIAKATGKKTNESKETEKADAKNTDTEKGMAATKKKQASFEETGNQATYSHDNGIEHIDLMM
ncbi:MAG TPA: hypothetical protein PLO51_03535 [Candidatus Micrarchaeota archaeon]|nr:hypothetical protein [Candidatus Micrarchaeota archaeon]